MADFRKGFTGVRGLVRAHMHKEVTDGVVFIFLNRLRNAIKLLKWEQNGLAIYHKRLEPGLFEAPIAPSDGSHMRITSKQLSQILHGIRLSSVLRNKRFTFRASGYPHRVNEGQEKCT